MSEQIINTPASRLLQSARGKLYIFAVALLTLCLSACLPSGEQDINTELFKSKDDLQARTESLSPGMTKQATFQTLNISPDMFERMSMQDVQMSIYGNSQVQGTPDELERFRNKLMTCEGYALPYREIKSSSSLGFGKLKVNKTGHDLKLVLIFEKDKLMRASIEGTQQVNQQDDQYLWESLLRRGIGAAF